MSRKDFATRRRFFFGAGAAALTAPAALAAAAAGASPRGELDREALEARLAALEDANAIRALQQGYLRTLGDEIPVSAAVPGAAIEIAADRSTATASTACVVQVETPIDAPPGCTLVDMARAQGEGVVRRSERRTLVQTFVRRDAAWRIESAELRDGG